MAGNRLFSSPVILKALRGLKQNPWGAISLAIILFFVLVAVFAYVIAPDDTRYANQMHLSIHSQPPGFEVDMLKLPIKDAPEVGLLEELVFGKPAQVTEIPISDLKIENNHVFYRPYDRDGQMLPWKKVSSGLEFTGGLDRFRESYFSEKTFLLGTDKFGRDLLSRLIIGTRISISIGLVTVMISLLIGIPMGAIGGYYGGKVDAVIMWIINVTWSIPSLLMVIAITVALGKGFYQVFIAVGLTMWVEVARVVRGQVIVARQYQYVTAAKALGFGNFRIIRRHILPNVLAPVIVISAANFAAAILIESGLSFLGLGAQPPMPSWGGMIKDHYQYIIMDKAYLAIAPGLAIMVLVMAFMLLGNALRDILDVSR